MVMLNLDRAKENIQKLNCALVGCLLGRRLPFWVVQNEVHRKWGHLGLQKITPMGMDCFICWFDSADARNNVLLGGPWYIAGQILGIDKWAPGLSAKTMKGFSGLGFLTFPLNTGMSLTWLDLRLLLGNRFSLMPKLRNGTDVGLLVSASGFIYPEA